MRHLIGMTAACLLVVAAGCGESKSSGGSLAAQYQRALKTADPESRAKKLVSLAYRQQDAGDEHGAEQSLSAAEQACEQIEQPAGRAGTLNRVAFAQAKLGHDSDAKKTLKEVREALEGVEEAEAKVPVIALLAETYGAHLDERTTAVYFLGEGEKIVAEIERPEGRVAAQLKLARAYHRARETQDAERLMSASLEAARALEDQRQRTEMLAEAAVTLSQLEQDEQGAQVLDEAVASAAEVEDELSRAYALVNLSQKLRVVNRKGDAAKVLASAEQIADQMTDASLKTPLLERIQAARKKS